MNESIRVPYGMTVHGEEEMAAVMEVLKTSTQMGPKVAEMESLVAKHFAKKYGIMVNSGSSALYLIADLLNLKEGDEFITPLLTFATTVAPFVKKGMVPVFVDVEEGTYNIDVNQVEQCIGPKTRALIIPNLIGNLADWPRLQKIAQKHNLMIVEDSADTLGGTIQGRSSGEFSHMSITSFYGSHVINCAGNGGMLCVNDDEHCRRAKLLRSWGRSSSLFAQSEDPKLRFAIDLDGIPYDAKFVFEELGYNLEPSEMGAAFGLVQLKKLSHNVQERERNFRAQIEFFQQYEEWFILPKQLPESKTGWLAFPLTIRENSPFSRTDLQIFLEERNIQTRPVFTGNILRQPAFKGVQHRCPGEAINADQVTKGGILLACHHGLTPEMLKHIQSSFQEFAQKFS